MSIEVWIDTRERHIIPYFDALDGKKIPPYTIELKTLSAGDYAVVYKDWIIMLIERKSWQDLAATFLDRNRKFNYEKMIEERNKFGCHLFYLVEGHRPAHGVHHVTTEKLEAHLDHLYFDHGIVTIYSPSPEKTPERIFNLVKHYMTAHTNPFAVIEAKFGGLPDNVRKPVLQLDILDEKSPTPATTAPATTAPATTAPANIPSASSSLGTAKKHSDQAIEYALWNSIEGITELNYVALTDIGTSLGGLLTGQYTVGQLGHAKYRLGTLVGEKKLTKILNSAISPDTHIKVMSQIPSISPARAKIILANYSMTDIITGVVDETKLANIIIPSDKKKTNEPHLSDLAFGNDMYLSVSSNNSSDLVLNPSVGLVGGNNISTNGRRLGATAAANIIKYLRTKH
jgi:hypothetical protein